MKRHLFAVVCCLIAIAAIGCSDRTPLRIGYVGSLVGKLSDLGVPGRNGAQLALETVNAQGGIAGRMLGLVVEDDGNDPDKARNAVELLAEQGVVGIIGHMTSDMSMAGYPVAEKLGIPMISPTTATPLLAGKKDLFFRVLTVSDQWAAGLARYALKQGNLNAVYVLDTDNRSYSIPFSKAFDAVYVQGGGHARKEVFFASSQISDWTGLADKIIAAAPDSVVVAMSARDLASLARMLESKDVHLPIYSAMWGYTRDILLTGGEAVEGIAYGVGYVDDESSPAFAEFRLRYMERFGWEPNFAAALSYEATMLLLAGLEQTGGSREGLEDALVNLSGMQGVIGDYALDEYGDVVRNSYIVTIRNRRFVVVDEMGE